MKPGNNQTDKIRTESEKAGKASISMHNNVDICDDCCSCAAEPYWIEAMTQQDTELEPEKQDKQGMTFYNSNDA